MKIKLIVLNMASFFILSFPTEKQLLERYKKEKSKVFLLSYPRSGNTWLRYCIEFLTKRPTMEHFPFGNFPGLSVWWNFSVPHTNIDFSKDIIWKVHFRRCLTKTGYYSKKRDKLILLLRDYKEALIRNNEKIFEGNFLKKRPIKEFFDNLLLFEEWSHKNRLLIYYEDLIKSPREVFQKILDFLGEDHSRLNDFMCSYNDHKKRSLLFYSTYNSPTQTNGEVLVYHAKKLTIEKKRKIDQQIAKHYPFLWENYLTIYKN